jgi:hypothetical protein
MYCILGECGSGLWTSLGRPTWFSIDNVNVLIMYCILGECGSGLWTSLGRPTWFSIDNVNVLIMYCMLYYRWVWCRTRWTSLASPTWTCWRYQSASCQTTWGTCGSVPASLTVPSMWGGRRSRHTNPSWQVRLGHYLSTSTSPLSAAYQPPGFNP